jgi:hypothetical protein
VDDPILAQSALKHGLGEEEILHAMAARERFLR